MHTAAAAIDVPDRRSAVDGAEFPLAVVAMRTTVAAYALRHAILRGEFRGRLTETGRYLVDADALGRQAASAAPGH